MDQEIKVGTVLTALHWSCPSSTYKFSKIANQTIYFKGCSSSYPLNPLLFKWIIVSQPEKELTFEDLEVGKTYCVKCNEDLRYSVVYKDSTGAAMCNSSGKLIAVGFNEGCIKYWKEYVEPKPEPVPVEYDVIWHKGGCNNNNKIVAVFVPVGVRPKDIKDILKIETVKYN